jgi:hypothetical protein
MDAKSGGSILDGCDLMALFGKDLIQGPGEVIVIIDYQYSSLHQNARHSNYDKQLAAVAKMIP